MGIQTKYKVGNNDPCPCESGLKYKQCHGNPTKVEICNRVANEKMVQLIREEQRKKILELQRQACDKCGHSGYVYDGTRQRKCSCQFTDEKGVMADEYKRLTENKGD